MTSAFILPESPESFTLEKSEESDLENLFEMLIIYQVGNFSITSNSNSFSERSDVVNRAETDAAG